MSGKHSAGKGDKSRISDFKQYQENYEKGLSQNMLDKENIRQWLIV